MKEISEKELIDLCRKGDRKAQKAVFDRLAPKMFPVCLRYIPEREVAQDLLQDGFVTLFTKIDSYKGNGSFEGWARTVFVTTVLMYLRKKDALKMSEDITVARNLSSEGSTQIQALGYKELLKMISELPTGFRTVFNLYVIEGFSHKDIAEMLGISEVTSRSQLSRARAMLQEKIKRIRNV